MSQRYLLVLPFLCVLLAPLAAQAPVDYRDAVLIINRNDTNSVAIGAYFAAHRDIPERNILRLDVPAKETITFEEFTTLRTQVEQFLTSTGLVDSVNYFITTKGVPLRITHGTSDNLNNASVDAELMLILGRHASHIGQNTLINPDQSVNVHPYFGRDLRYRRTAMVPGSNPPVPFDLFLTTRLIGLTKEDVFALIDRSGPYTLVNKDSALFVFDRDPKPIQLNPYDVNLASAGTLLSARGWNTMVNEDSVYVTGKRNVLGYGSWGSNDHYDHHFTEFARPKFHWLPGSLAETYVSTSARNFVPGSTAGQSRIADLIAEGCTGASGYVYEPYTLALTWVNSLFDRYTRGYNLAESFYMSNPTLSWMAVIVGDPKTSIITALPPLPSPTVEQPGPVCAGMTVTLEATSSIDGLRYWFAGDSTQVQALGGPFDSRHPLWIGEGEQLLRTMNEAGEKSFCFLNHNFIGKGWAQCVVQVLPALQVTIHRSADTLYLDEDPTLNVNATADGATTFGWLFGDGASGSGANATHRYTRTGSFRVQCTVGNGICTASSEAMVYVLATRPTVRVAEGLLDFGIVTIGATSSRSLTVRNGLSTAVSITAIGIQGAQAGEYQHRAITLPLAIAPGSEAVLQADFTPAAEGSRVAELQIALSDGLATLRVPLSGVGTTVQTDVDALAIAQSVKLEAHPQPVSSILRLHFQAADAGVFRYRVLDVAGREVLRRVDGAATQGPRIVTLDVTALQPGFYLLLAERGRQHARTSILITR